MSRFFMVQCVVLYKGSQQYRICQLPQLPCRILLVKVRDR